jgi:hypothetical protein
MESRFPMSVVGRNPPPTNESFEHPKTSLYIAFCELLNWKRSKRLCSRKLALEPVELGYGRAHRCALGMRTRLGRFDCDEVELWSILM